MGWVEGFLWIGQVGLAIAVAIILVVTQHDVLRSRRRLEEFELEVGEYEDDTRETEKGIQEVLETLAQRPIGESDEERLKFGDLARSAIQTLARLKAFDNIRYRRDTAELVATRRRLLQIQVSIFRTMRLAALTLTVNVAITLAPPIFGLAVPRNFSLGIDSIALSILGFLFGGYTQATRERRRLRERLHFILESLDKQQLVGDGDD